MNRALHSRIGNSSWRELPLVAAWLTVVGGSLACFQWYKATSGCVGDVAGQWPEDGPLRRSPSGETLLMFAHPRCPCTSASLNELAAVLAAPIGPVAVNVVFYRPDAADETWTDSNLVRRAAAMSGVRILWDDGGRLARQFRVETSGHVLAFDRRGELTFSGGITPIRGHEGGNPGRDTLVACLRNRTAATKSGMSIRGPAAQGSIAKGLVFGCPLGRDRRQID